MKNNTCSDSFFNRIASRAATLREITDTLHKFNYSPGEAIMQNRRLEEWQQAVAPDNPKLFLKRLTFDGISQDRLHRILGDVSYKDDSQLPGWTSVFKDLLEFLTVDSSPLTPEEMLYLYGSTNDNKLPFLHLITPFVRFAVNKLAEKCGDQLAERFSDGAVHQLHQQLAAILFRYTGQTFLLEFKVFKASAVSPFSRVFQLFLPSGNPGTDFYHQFVEKISGDGWRGFFSEYCALARIIVNLITYWVQNTFQLIKRLDADYVNITNYFTKGISPGKVTGISGSVSDSHSHGKSVHILEFESGFKIVYKPKNLELEQAWSVFTGWINETGFQPDLKPLDVMHRGEYGWVGFMRAAACANEHEISGYYRRTGALTGIIYLLHGNDFHNENLIASGEYPVLIDLESVMHHEGKASFDDNQENARLQVTSMFSYSVLRTGLLPGWIPGRNGFIFDLSGIGAVDQVETPYTWLKWEHINTDLMDAKQEPVNLSNDSNMPAPAGTAHSQLNYADEITEGFTLVYRHLMKYRHQAPLHLFKGKELRYIFRATRVYGLIDKVMLGPRFMRSGIDRSIRLELLARAFLSEGSSSDYWNIFKSEVRQMEDNDFPIFWTVSDNTFLKDQHGTLVQNFTDGVVYDRVTHRLQELNEQDLSLQLRFIRASLYFKEALHTGNNYNETNSAEVSGLPEAPDKERLTSLFFEIGRQLKAEAIFSENGTCSWITAGIIPGSDRYRLEPMSVYLYDGIAGVALFLAALGTLTNNSEITGLRDSVLKTLLGEINILLKYPGVVRLQPIGIAAGIPSLIYTLIKVSDVMTDPTLLTVADSLAELITPSMIGRDRSFDIISGSSGCLLAMLALNRATGHQGALQTAESCAAHLLQNAVENPGGSIGWRNPAGEMLTGFAHGQSGIAYAMIQLYEFTGNELYREMALSAIQYENSLFSEKHQNWPDLRKSMYNDNKFPEKISPENAEELQFMDAWCHGASGIGLAHRLISRSARLPDAGKYSDAALTATLKAGIYGHDHLCCGNLGRIDILLHAALKYQDKDLLNKACLMAGAVIQRSETRQKFSLISDAIPGFYHPGFFQGMSGVGYALLRLAYPDKFPSVLAFE